jgi:predicted aminopeptidase
VRRALLAAFLALPLGACSPIYAFKAAAGHTKLLWNRKSIAKSVADPKTPPELKARLSLALEAREFAFDELKLKKSKDYTTWSEVGGDVLTWLVQAAPKLELKPHLWRFPLIGSFPYKGYFKKADAQAEAKKMEERGFDVTITGASAYKTPLWISDPLPSTALYDSPGQLAALIIHELTHGTLFHKDQVQFDETLAEFVGETGAQQFLRKKFGDKSPELADYREDLSRERRLEAAFGEIYERLDALYKSTAAVEAKLAARDEVFAWGRERLAKAGRPYPKLNNAVVLAHRVYHDAGDRAALEKAFSREAGEWARVVAAMKALDAKDPSGALKKSTGP